MQVLGLNKSESPNRILFGPFLHILGPVGAASLGRIWRLYFELGMTYAQITSASSRPAAYVEGATIGSMAMEGVTTTNALTIESIEVKRWQKA